MIHKNSIGRRKRHFIFWMLFFSILFPIFFSYYPMAKGFVMAFQNYNLLNIKNIHWCGLDNFRELFSRSPGNSFYTTIGNTVKWVFISLFFQFTIGFGLALLLKKRFKGSDIYQGIIFFPWAVSGFLIGIIWRWLYNGTSGVFNDLLVRIGILSEPFGEHLNIALCLHNCKYMVWYPLFYDHDYGSAEGCTCGFIRSSKHGRSKSAAKVFPCNNSKYQVHLTSYAFAAHHLDFQFPGSDLCHDKWRSGWFFQYYYVLYDAVGK